MKYAPPIQLSTLQGKHLQRRVQTIDYLEGFWPELFKGAGKSILNWHRPPIKALVSTPVRFVSLSLKRAVLLFKTWNSHPHNINIRFRWLWLAFWMIHFYPSPGHTVYADPIASKYVAAPVQAINMPALSPQEPLEQVFISKLRDYGTYANTFYPNNCTSYVASRLPVTWSGDAYQWAANAAAAGYKVSAVPDVGTIATNTTDSYLGHVAIVAEIANGMVRLEEQNYEGPGVISSDRWAPIYQYQYIYI